MSEDADPAKYQPTIQLVINWKPGEIEPHVDVWVEADCWRLPAVARVLKQAIDWFHAQESYVCAEREGHDSSLEANNVDRESDTLFTIVHDVIYSEEPEEARGLTGA